MSHSSMAPDISPNRLEECPRAELTSRHSLGAHLHEQLQVTADLEGSPAPVAVDETGIAWESDIKHKFGSQDAQNFNLQEDAEHRGGGTITGGRASALQVTNL